MNYRKTTADEKVNGKKNVELHVKKANNSGMKAKREIQIKHNLKSFLYRRWLFL